MTGPGPFPVGYPGQVQMGATPARSRKGGTPARDGVPHPPDRTVDGVLDTRRAVCLLRSRRRTFLYDAYFLKCTAGDKTSAITDHGESSMATNINIVECFAPQFMDPVLCTVHGGETHLSCAKSSGAPC